MIAYGKFTRLHLFRAPNHHEIVQNIVQAAQQYMNISLKVVGSQITLSKFEQEKFGAYSYVFHVLHGQFDISTGNFLVKLQKRQFYDINVGIYCT